MNKNSNQM